MTLIVCSYVPTGIVVAGDSRTTGMRQVQQVVTDASGKQMTLASQTPWVLSDSTRKVFSIHDAYAVATWGDAFVHEMPIAHQVNEFAMSSKGSGISTPEGLADALLAHFVTLDPNLATGFLVAGYSGIEPWVIELDVAKNSKLRRNADPASGALTYGMFYGGDGDVLSRLLSKPETNPPFNLLNLQDAVDLTRHLIRTTIDQMRFEPRFATVGGHIDTITATPVRTRFLVRKELRAKDLQNAT